jgi:hypothetical protein
MDSDIAHSVIEVLESKDTPEVRPSLTSGRTTLSESALE